jgi:hypothetical protein
MINLITMFKLTDSIYYEHIHKLEMLPTLAGYNLYNKLYSSTSGTQPRVAVALSGG